MTVLTPKKYWRIAFSEEQGAPTAVGFLLPQNLASQKSPPKSGEGILLASYDADVSTGLVSHLGIVRSANGAALDVAWCAVRAEIWVDTPVGRGFWKNQAGFGFAPAKVGTYGLNELFAANFEGLESREHHIGTPVGPRPVKVRAIAGERLNPIEQIGERTSGPRCGIVYVLKSAYGYKVGRTRKFPDRMRTFGVQLPFFYTIPLCVWFDDHVQAEKSYHEMFQSKRINGEWFDLNDDDIQKIRGRVFA